ncbi:Phototropic-responsive NPH3 family protein [Corchorus olitorius]|uniref:Phototropic-responsive NPH3 family protein n=1 Tax=Corchorus olitorius TaxID=93759 RepID=A0A1R3K9B7_9ROSI|nr:Phototropic-responsive NPH3 family protein [Corchorus olitorius]
MVASPRLSHLGCRMAVKLPRNAFLHPLNTASKSVSCESRWFSLDLTLPRSISSSPIGEPDRQMTHRKAKRNDMEDLNEEKEKVR